MPSSGFRFRRIAGRYQIVNKCLSFGLDRLWRKRLVEALALQPGMKLLDVGAGPGDIINLINCPILAAALDPERAMLEAAPVKLADPVIGVAEFLPFASNSFDRITAAFALRNFSSRAEGLFECFRVLKPGGIGSILEFSPPRGTALAFLARIYIRLYLPIVAGLLSGDPAAYRYLSTTIQNFPPPAVIAEEIARAGFIDVKWRSLIGKVTVLHSFAKPDG